MRKIEKITYLDTWIGTCHYLSKWCRSSANSTTDAKSSYFTANTLDTMFVSLLPYPKPALFMVVEYIDLENMQGGSDAYELNIAQDQETVARVERLGHRMSYMVSDGMSGKRFFLAAFQFHPGELDEFEMGFRILWK